MSAPVETVATKPFSGQKPGTSGLRKKVTEFFQPHYVENFVQCTLEAIGSELEGATLVVGGDGRYGVKDVVAKIIQIAAANKVSKIIVGQDGILSTPAVSNLIRKNATTGGIILTASHNPGGKTGDFGIKYNMGNGGPAPSDFTERIFALSKEIREYKICPCVKPNIGNTPGTAYNYMIGDEERQFTVIVADSIQDYIDLMKGIFNFEEIKEYLKSQRILINSLHGVTGPYAERIFGDELGAPKPSSFMKTNILEDFGGGHPDPNLTYAKDLVDAMKAGDYGFGAAFDGDGDRNMILGAKAFFVTPCDSLAVIANNLGDIPYFQKEKVVGYARSMPTSLALDRVAAARGKKCFETPTGWKFFGNLLDAGEIALCGEESFGTGSNHIREKDGIWAALAWLQILAKKKMSVEEVLRDHWNQFGRNFFTRYDYEECDGPSAQKMMDHLQSLVDSKGLPGKKFKGDSKEFVVSKADNFEYVDPIDKSVTKNQGIRIFFEDGSRIVFRLSGTGSSGATIRMYVDSYEHDKENYFKAAGEMLRPCILVALQISKLKEFTGRDEPTVIT